MNTRSFVVLKYVKVFTIVMLLSISRIAQAQESVGIKFEDKLSWEQVLQKAKQEKKYVFVDIYTTWCVPCQVMAKNIFTQAKAGEFFNKSFINVAVQMDVTKKDNAFVKSWYKDAANLERVYKIESYPSYLFFNPDGELMHRINGGSATVDDFVSKAKLALDPATQYSNMKRDYKRGKRNPAFLLKLIYASRIAGDMDSIGTLVNSYLRTDSNWGTKQNLELIRMGTTKSTDAGFQFARTHAALMDSVLGKNTSKGILKTIAFDEIVLPLIRINGKKILTGGMWLYSGEVNKNVDWNLIKEKLDASYPDLAEELVLYAKPFYFQSAEDWKGFCHAVDVYAAHKGFMNIIQLDNYARTVLYSCEDPEYFKAAIGWSNVILSSIDKTKMPQYLTAYAYLLYKSGQKDMALKTMEEYLGLITYTDEDASKKLEKMKANEGI
ncbi:MAG: thioredoxin family protein [Bacteroidota bacterium]